MRLRFISPMAQITSVTVDAVQDGQPLVYNEVYTVSDEIAEKLLVNEADWERVTSPRKVKETEVVEGANNE